ncbi:hypothetical protein [Aureibaculum luteum]|uniref:hypothetical protein n=1 Tax=Aureibaculum luteum TaxID=1548456 RepID=UPI000E54FF18|nr:hypothetical protein [Aureibaculum luteum]
MRIKYTVLSGHIKHDSEECVIQFALVSEKKGVYSVETFLSDPTFFERTDNSYYYSLVGITEKGYDIEISGLFCSTYTENNQKAKFKCYGNIKLEDNKKERPKQESYEDVEDNFIYAIEIDGLKIEFSDSTTINEYRNGSQINKFGNFKFDHTSIGFFINHKDFICNFFNMVLTRNTRNKNILIDFRDPSSSCRLLYKNYLKFRDELLSFLSFINGSIVILKKEYTGWYISEKGLGEKTLDAQLVNLYSRKEITKISSSDYLPINDYRGDTNEVFSKMFFQGFDKFYHLGQELDFKSLILSLNSTNEINIEERYFILITALEKVSKNHLHNSTDTPSELISTELFKNTIQAKIIETIKKFKDEIDKENKTAWSIFLSKIGNLNKLHKGETTNKLYSFLNYAKIPLNEEVKSLVNIERNIAVHEGDFGENDNERLKNYYKLDHILRDCILNLINYDGVRKRRFNYDK